MRKARRYVCVVNPCVLASNTPGLHMFQGTHKRLTSWWLNQPICKNMIVKLDHFPTNGGEHKK